MIKKVLSCTVAVSARAPEGGGGDVNYLSQQIFFVVVSGQHAVDTFTTGHI